MGALMRYIAIVKYDGSAYFGWQKQVNELTIQAVIEDKISTIFNEEISIFASGRTDAKVHAYGQVFHFDAKVFPLKKLQYALNRMLPNDIEIVSLKKGKADFHARYSARKKTYSYLISLTAKDPFLNNHVLFYPSRLNLEALKNNAKKFIGKHNFQNFTSKESDEANFIREIYDIKVTKKGILVRIDFTGNGFMRGQIRFMVGTLLALNDGKVEMSFIEDNLSALERNIVPFKVSGSGLYLVKVYYS